MKKIFLFLFCVIIVSTAHSQDGHVATPASVNISIEKLSAADWQADLRFLQQTVHTEYAFLFKKITAADFDAAVEKLYKAMPGMQVHERIAGIARIVSLFKYGHTSIGWRQSPFKYHVAPVNFYWFSDGLYAEGADKKYASIVGAKLVKVEGMPVMQALEAVKPLVPVENDQYFKAYGLDFIAIPEALHAQGISKELKTNVTYTFEKDGKTFEQTVEAIEGFHLPRNYGFVTPGPDWISVRDQNSTAYYLKNINKNYYYEYLTESKTVYVRQSQVLDDKEETIAAFYKKVFEFIDKNDVDKMVIDVRLNGGGNNYKNKPVVTGIIESKKINKPGKLFVITGRRTFSACQNLVNELSNYTNALFVGEPTAENINFYGDTRRVDLPKTGIPVFLSFAWWQDKPQWENADWLAPQLAVDMSFEEYKTNKDPVLDACLNFSDKDVVLDPVGRLKELFMAGKMDEVEKEATKMVADPKYRYYNFETKFNDAGYNMLNGNQTDAALFVFQLNTKLFPKSANAWDSFAEANWKAKKIDKAIEYYNKAIELDPHGVTGDNGRNMLKKIQAEKGN
jgi:tetratricopeptide (TPR) repeat protein